MGKYVWVCHVSAIIDLLTYVLLIETGNSKILLNLFFSNGDTISKSGTNYRTIIRFYCNPDVHAQVEFEDYDGGDTFYIAIHAWAACAPEATQCKMEDKNGVVYNLQQLKKENGESYHVFKKFLWRVLSLDFNLIGLLLVRT